MSQWQSLSRELISFSSPILNFSHRGLLAGGLSVGPRKEVPINIDGRTKSYAIIYEDQYGGIYKLYGGNVFDNTFTGW